MVRFRVLLVRLVLRSLLACTVSLDSSQQMFLLSSAVVHLWTCQQQSFLNIFVCSSLCAYWLQLLIRRTSSARTYPDCSEVYARSTSVWVIGNYFDSQVGYLVETDGTSEANCWPSRLHQQCWSFHPSFFRSHIVSNKHFRCGKRHPLTWHLPSNPQHWNKTNHIVTDHRWRPSAKEIRSFGSASVN